MKKRVAIYCRVSTSDQSPENQLLDLRRFVESRGFEIYKEYIDRGVSGSKANRPALNELMKDAKKRRFDSVAVWKFDRFGRSVKHLIESLELFRSLKIDFISFQENVDTSTSTGKLVFDVMAAISEFERSLIQERIKSGLRRAKAKGKRLGRPKKELNLRAIRILKHNHGLSLREIEKQLGVSRSVLSRRMAEAGEPIRTATY